MGTTAEKLSYLNTTKTKIKDVLNLGGANITNETFREYADKIKDRYLYYMLNGTQVVWNNWNKVSGTGTTLTLNNTEEAPMSLVYKGNTLQNGTPTPDSPQTIHTVSGDNSIEVCGKNLFDKSAILENKLISSTGAINDSTGGFVSDYIFLKGGTTYYNNTRGYSNAVFYNLSKTFIERADLSQNSTFTPTNDCYVRLNGKLENINTYQFEINNQATTYEAYKGASYPITLPEGMELCKIGTYQDKIDKSSGKNLFDSSNTTILNGYFDGSHTTLTSAGTNRTTYFVCEPNTTYTISRLRSSRGFIGTTQTTPVLGVSISNISNAGYGAYDGTTRVSGTITTGTNDNYIVINYANTNTETGDIPTYVLNSIQIEKRSTATSYEPYGTGWYLKKEIGKYTITGQESDSQYYWSSEINGIKFILDDAIKTVASAPTYCNRFNQWYSGTTANNYVRLNRTTDSNYVGFWFGNLTISGVSGITTFKTYASTNDIILYYPLATPTYETITDTTLISQLEEAKKSYESQTNISQTPNDLPFELDVVALNNQ